MRQPPFCTPKALLCPSIQQSLPKLESTLLRQAVFHSIFIVFLLTCSMSAKRRITADNFSTFAPATCWNPALDLPQHEGRDRTYRIDEHVQRRRGVPTLALRESAGDQTEGYNREKATQ